AVNVLLHLYSNQGDIIIGSPVAGREHADLEGQIGFYLNTLAIRVRFSGEDSYETLLARVKQVLLEAYEHQMYPFDELIDTLQVQRDPSRHPLFDVMIGLLHADPNGSSRLQASGGIKISEYIEEDQIISKFDLSFHFIEMAEKLELSIVYNSDIYTESTVDRLYAHLEQLLASISANPSHPINQLDYLNAEEKHVLLVAFNE